MELKPGGEKTGKILIRKKRIGKGTGRAGRYQEEESWGPGQLVTAVPPSDSPKGNRQEPGLSEVTEMFRRCTHSKWMGMLGGPGRSTALFCHLPYQPGFVGVEAVNTRVSFWGFVALICLKRYMNVVQEPAICQEYPLFASFPPTPPLLSVPRFLC